MSPEYVDLLLRLGMVMGGLSKPGLHEALVAAMREDPCLLGHIRALVKKLDEAVATAQEPKP